MKPLHASLLACMLFLLMCLCACQTPEPTPNEHRHTYADWSVTKNATCTAEGEKKRYCSCGEYQTETIPTVAHAYENGACSVCGKAEQVTQEHTHDYGAWVTVKEASCKDQGMLRRVCECGNSQTKLTALGEHTYTNGVCSVCGQADDHTHVFIREEVTREATCREIGELTSYCACGYAYKQAYGVKEHIYIDEVCKWCGDRLAHQHNYSGWSQTKAPTCEKEGEMSRRCTCGDTQTKSIAKVDHSYVNGVCTMCKQQNTDTFVPDCSAGEVNTVGTVYGSCYSFAYTAQGDWVYLASSQRQLMKFKKSTMQSSVVYTIPSGILLCVNAVGDWLYFYVGGETDADCYVAKVRTDGSGFEKLLSGVRIEELLVVKNTIFYTTIKNPYTNYAKDCAPLYMMSTSGGASKQLYDGYVSSLVSDGTYVYFRHAPKSVAASICRIKCDGSAAATLYSRCDANYIFLENGKLYFVKFDEDAFESTMASISTKGGSYTVYGKIPYYAEWLFVHGDSIYYLGEPYGSSDWPTYGLIEYNTVKRTYTVVYEEMEGHDYAIAFGMIILQTYDSSYALERISVYNVKTKQWLDVRIK